MSAFSLHVQLEVDKPASELSEIEGYLITELVRDWKRQYDQITSQSFRGNRKLEQYLSDGDITKEDMSHDLRNRTPYGLTLAS